ncbi:hypothetical protein ACVIDN_003943 [Rhizobium brockwellii]
MVAWFGCHLIWRTLLKMGLVPTGGYPSVGFWLVQMRAYVSDRKQRIPCAEK